MSAPRRLFVSFSGGETSGYMLWYIWAFMRSEYDEIVVVFANTGEEWEATLEFVQYVSMLFEIPVVWVEAVVSPEYGKGISFQIVNFATASRNGEPFEAVIAKYGIPNSKRMHCTRDLKLYPMLAYAKYLGWAPGTYDTAVGIRADEIDRMSQTATEQRIIYPLISRKPVRKPQINFWWELRPFRLMLEGFNGNCKVCHKKSFRKLFTIASRTPEAFRFTARMEATYGLVGAEFRKEPPETTPRVFFRGGKSTIDLLREYAELGDAFIPADDENRIFDEMLDTAGACGESCEVYADE